MSFQPPDPQIDAAATPAPVVTINDPTAGQVITTVQYTVILTATDETGIDPTTVQVSTDNVNWYTLAPVNIIPVPASPADLIGGEQIGQAQVGHGAG